MEVQNIAEAGPHENSLKPGGGTAHGDLKIKTIADIVSALGTKSQEDLNGFKASLVPPTPVGGGNAGNLASIKSSGALKQSIKEDLNTIFGGAETLSEEFMDQATVLFESAVEIRVAAEVEGLEESFEQRLNENTADFIEKATGRLDSYLDYVAEQFMEKNAVAIEGGVRLELAESLLAGLGTLFSEHNVHIDAEKLDVVAELEERVETLSAQLEEQVNENERVAAEIEAREITNIVNSVCEGLTDTDKERLFVLAETIDYSDVADFEKKFTTVREAFYQPSSLTENTDNNGLVLEEVQAVDTTTQEVIKEDVAAPAPKTKMSAYADFMSSQAKRG